MIVPEEWTVSAEGPATVANLGPGFDVLGLALGGPGDVVHARRCARPGVHLGEVVGDGGRLPTEAAANTAGVAALHTLSLAGVETGVELALHKRLPLCSGLGSSAASAAAAAHAVNLLVGSPLRKAQLVGPCIEAEAVVSGRHADNVAPAVLGGLVLVRSVDPVDLIRLPIPDGLTVVVVSPAFDLATRDARAVLPESVPLSLLVAHSAALAAMVSALHAGDMALLGRSMVDVLATPRRAPLVPGAEAAIAAALSAGALGSSLSGSGPAVFALCRSARGATAAGQAMQEAFASAGLQSVLRLAPADAPGVRRWRQGAS